MFDVDEPISDYQKAIRERAAESLGNLHHALSQPTATSPTRKDDYSSSVARLKTLLKKYDDKNKPQFHLGASFCGPTLMIHWLSMTSSVILKLKRS